MALKKQKQFVSDVKTIVSEGRKVGRLKKQIGKAQATNRAMKGGGVAGLSGTSASYIAESMNRKKKSR